MTHLNHKKQIGITLIATLALLLSACASKQTEKPSTRYVGFSEALLLNDKTLHSGEQFLDYNTLVEKARMLEGHNTKSWFSTTVPTPSGQIVIVRREFAVGSIETNFGKPAELIFSIQPCINIQNNPQIVCRDPVPASAMIVRKQIIVRGGESLVAHFANGMIWKYILLDQPEPY